MVSSPVGEFDSELQTSEIQEGIMKQGIFRLINSAEYYKLLQSYIDSLQKLHIKNYAKINILKTNRMFFTLKSTGSVLMAMSVIY
jgi:23S rRNA A2030 N6-methylase RlmJ